jgi:CHASE2 domain-containing sensor protein
MSTAPTAGSASAAGSAPARTPRVAILAVAVCVLAVAAAVVAFVNGSWLGVPFVLLAAVDGNIAWYYILRARHPRRVAASRDA